MQSKFRIIGCPEWGAAPPLRGLDSIVWTPDAADKFVIHHTAGHHPEISNPANESVAELVLYAKRIQKFHQTASKTDPSKPWNDSGHNWLIGRNGIIVQGRWRTIRAIQDGRMVVSAHCPGQNHNIGIEHEHKGEEEMTLAQREASAYIQAWCSKYYHKQKSLPAFPHSSFINTSCPANLIDDIRRIRERANEFLSRGAV